MNTALALSYWNLNECASGGIRRINALLGALEGNVLLCQPGPPHPAYETITLPADMATKRRGFNRGLLDFFHPANAAVARKAIRERRPSVIVLTSIWTYFPIAASRRTPLILDAHDMLAAAMAERYGAGHPFTLIVMAWERFVTRRVDHIFACSEPDRARFLSRYRIDPGQVSVAPNGVDVAQHDRADLANVPFAVQALPADACLLLFMGKLSYEPNVRGLAFLDRSLMPELERRAPGRFKLIVSGGPVPASRMHPSILFAGTLTDVQLVALLKRADICLSPTFSGGGTRLKILEYMAARKPVVSTPKGIEGLDCTNGREVVVADADRFPDAIDELMRHPDKARAMAEAAYQLVRSQYDWTGCVQPIWRKTLSRWLACTPAPS